MCINSIINRIETKKVAQFLIWTGLIWMLVAVSDFAVHLIRLVKYWGIDDTSRELAIDWALQNVPMYFFAIDKVYADNALVTVFFQSESSGYYLSQLLFGMGTFLLLTGVYLSKLKKYYDIKTILRLICSEVLLFIPICLFVFSSIDKSLKIQGFMSYSIFIVVILLPMFVLSVVRHIRIRRAETCTGKALALDLLLLLLYVIPLMRIVQFILALVGEMFFV
ncbi:MAG: hypothetical protein E7312_06215 [Clostridiales bacterium]|nr:hypothetical protein [Clostridiales bacterium]